MSKEIDSLKRSIYITRKSRINASERLINSEKFIQVINMYYSCFLCGMSVYSLISTDSFSIISTILSIVLTISIFFFSSQRFGDRAQYFKKNYIELQKLYFKIENLGEEENLKEYKNEYINLLLDSENHSTYDYYKAVLHLDEKLNKLALINYYLHNVCIFIFKMGLFLTPIFFVIFMIFINN